MDASLSPKPVADNEYCFSLKLGGKSYCAPLQQNNTVIKYTKLPDFDVDAKGSLPSAQSYTLQPRLRRIIFLDEDNLKTNRSLRSNFASRPKEMAANYTKRKIVTISKDDNHDPHPGYFTVRKKNISPGKTSTRATGIDFKPEKQPSNRINSRLTSATKFLVSKKSTSPVKLLNKSMETDFKSERQPSSRITSRLTSAKYTKETKTSAKTNSAYNKKEVNVTQQNYYRRSSPPTENSKMKSIHEKVSQRHSRSTQAAKTTNISKNFIIQSDSEKELARIKNIFYDNLKKDINCKQKSVERPSLCRSPLTNKKDKVNLKELKIKLNLKELQTKPIKFIRVPREDDNRQPEVTEIKSNTIGIVRTIGHGNPSHDILMLNHVNVGTDPPKAVDQVTEMDDFKINKICRSETSMQTESMKEIFDSLEIPNVTLTKEKSEPKEIVQINSLPNLKVSPFNVSPAKEDVNSSDISFCQGASYIISKATLTYTTRQKINFHIVGNDEDVSSKIPPSPLEYPINVMPVFKKDLQNKQDNVLAEDVSKKENNPKDGNINCLNELNSPNCSYVFNKLMKPSDIISTIRVNNDLLKNEYICEQFQRELNFIDSFFESLQYLESCSLTDKCFPDSQVDSLVNNSVLFDSTFAVKNSEYDNFLAKLENGANIDDTETMASQSLCLLNLLIRDEQRRAKNLLFVLKMREDALKDFTKSQILWLEKKKKHDNTDISTLKKKQRGALLKLQHECGEMQRMRKALLTLSEKRKLALMKTKKNIELKLKNNVDVEQIILGKKKLKRISPGDRNTSPLKCFDLSSSGCEESTTSKLNSDTAFVPTSFTKVTSAEKCVQTGEALSTNPRDHSSGITAENFVAVDGGYLNILFNDLSLPQIFSSGKQYEVNEEELKNIVSSTSNHCKNLSGSEVVEELMDQIKNKELDTSSPSTARSLLEEFDQYYRVLLEDDKSAPDSVNRQSECSSVKKVLEVKDLSVQFGSDVVTPVELATQTSTVFTSADESVLIYDLNLPNSTSESCSCQPMNLVEKEWSQISLDTKESVSLTSQTTGPLPVPVGAAAVVESPPPDVPVWTPPKSPMSSASDSEHVNSPPQNSSPSTLTSLTTPVQCEAEELRRQQLAIEREIKALEQQQCRLLVVREIPDKPPPPYTPPIETKPKPPRMFAIDKAAENKIEKLYTNSNDETCGEDAFDSFLKDFCNESVQSLTQKRSDKPWDACNLLPQKPQIDTQKQIQNTHIEIKEVLSSVPPTHVSGVSSRRSDHIDDILFTEWRRCEPDWTTLHTDEVYVKNQLFESIFQKILTETVDEYKKSNSEDKGRRIQLPCVLNPDVTFIYE